MEWWNWGATFANALSQQFSVLQTLPELTLAVHAAEPIHGEGNAGYQANKRLGLLGRLPQCSCDTCEGLE